MKISIRNIPYHHPQIQSSINYPYKPVSGRSWQQSIYGFNIFCVSPALYLYLIQFLGVMVWGPISCISSLHSDIIFIFSITFLVVLYHNYQRW